MQTIDLHELEKMRQLQLNIKRSLSSGEGVRRSSVKGRSAEFSGYREYIPGDDMRYVDWNAYARLDKLYIKEYMEEREGRVNIFLDTSKSMDFGRKLKSTLMAEITEVISYTALSGRDAAYVTDLRNPLNTLRVPTGEAGIRLLKKWLEDIRPEGSVSLYDSLRKAVRSRGGLGFVISDFMDEGFLDAEEDILKLFNFRDIRAVFLQILSEEELEIEEYGNYQFIDSEAEAKEVRVTLDNATVREYKRSLDNYTKQIRNKALSAGAGAVLCSTGDPLPKIIFEDLREYFL